MDRARPGSLRYRVGRVLSLGSGESPSKPNKIRPRSESGLPHVVLSLPSPTRLRDDVTQRLPAEQAGADLLPAPGQVAADDPGVHGPQPPAGRLDPRLEACPSPAGHGVLSTRILPIHRVPGLQEVHRQY